MARGRVFCMASCRLMPFLGSVVLILFSATLCRFTTAQRTMCPCKTLKGSYCKYNLKNKSSVWPYTGTCYELDIRCDCINCPVDDPTGNNPCIRTTIPPLPRSTAVPAKPTTLNPQPGPNISYAPNCMEFYFLHWNMSFVRMLGWNAGITDTATSLSRLNPGEITSTDYGARPLPALPLRITLDILISVLLLLGFFVPTMVDVFARRQCSSKCIYFSPPLKLLSLATSLGLLFTVPSILVFYVTLPLTQDYFRNYASDPSCDNGYSNNSQEIVNILEMFVKMGLGIVPASACGPSFGQNITTPNMACAIMFSPINVWALFCLFCQLLYIVGRPCFINRGRHIFARHLLNAIDVIGKERIAIVGDNDGLFTTAITCAMSKKVQLSQDQIVVFDNWWRPKHEAGCYKSSSAADDDDHHQRNNTKFPTSKATVTLRNCILNGFSAHLRQKRGTFSSISTMEIHEGPSDILNEILSGGDGDDSLRYNSISSIPDITPTTAKDSSQIHIASNNNDYNVVDRINSSDADVHSEGCIHDSALLNSAATNHTQHSVSTQDAMSELRPMHRAASHHKRCSTRKRRKRRGKSSRESEDVSICPICLHHWDYRVSAAPCMQHMTANNKHFHNTDKTFSSPNVFASQGNRSSYRELEDDEDNATFNEQLDTYFGEGMSELIKTPPSRRHSSLQLSNPGIFDILFIPDIYGMQAGPFDSRPLRNERCRKLLCNCLALLKPGGWLLTTAPQTIIECGRLRALQKCFTAVGTSNFQVLNQSIPSASILRTKIVMANRSQAAAVINTSNRSFVPTSTSCWCWNGCCSNKGINANRFDNFSDHSESQSRWNQSSVNDQVLSSDIDASDQVGPSTPLRHNGDTSQDKCYWTGPLSTQTITSKIRSMRTTQAKIKDEGRCLRTTALSIVFHFMVAFEILFYIAALVLMGTFWNGQWVDTWFVPVTFGGHLSNLIDGILEVFPFFAVVNLLRIWDYCSSSAHDLSELSLLSDRERRRILYSMPSVGGMCIRFLGGIVFQVTCSIFFTLCWWIPMVLIFSAASGHATDMWETQVRVWAGVVTSVIIGLFSPEPIRNICRRSASSNPCTAVGRTGIMNGQNVARLLSTPGPETTRLTQLQFCGILCCCYRDASTFDSEMENILAFNEKMDPLLPRRASVGSKQATVASNDRVDEYPFLEDAGLQAAIVARHRVPTLSSKERHANLSKSVTQLNTSDHDDKQHSVDSLVDRAKDQESMHKISTKPRLNSLRQSNSTKRMNISSVANSNLSNVATDLETYYPRQRIRKSLIQSRSQPMQVTVPLDIDGQYNEQEK